MQRTVIGCDEKSCCFYYSTGILNKDEKKRKEKKVCAMLDLIAMA
jgi:hypothetical protein